MTQSTLHTPAEIIANIPAFLGFYPTESVVAISIGPNGVMGPILRVDLTDAEQLNRHLENARAASTQPPTVLCFVLSADPEEREAAAAELSECTGVWGLAQIETAAPYERLDAHGPTRLQRSGVWERGKVANVATAAAMVHLVSAGDVPELTRSDTFAYFDRPEALDDDTAAELQATVEHWGELLVQKIADATVAPEDLAGIMRSALLDAQSAGAEALAPGGVPWCEEVLLPAVMWTNTYTRDLTLTAFAEGLLPAAHRCSLAAARTFTGELRANALCVFALTAAAQGMSVRSFPALLLANAEQPGHRLSQLLLQSFRRGLIKETISACFRGARCARDPQAG